MPAWAGHGHPAHPPQRAPPSSLRDQDRVGRRLSMWDPQSLPGLHAEGPLRRSDDEFGSQFPDTSLDVGLSGVQRGITQNVATQKVSEACLRLLAQLPPIQGRPEQCGNVLRASTKVVLGQHTGGA